MNKFLSFLILSFTLISTLAADVFMTELTDPQNSSDAGRYVELYNNGDSAVDLSDGWTVQRWTNGNADPTASSVVALTGSIVPGGFYIICNDADKFSATFGGTCDQDIGTGGFADSNGDDNMALLHADAIVDMFGIAGEDGSGTGHEFEDGRAERAAGNTTASATWEESGWNVDNDSGGGDGNQYAPEGFDPGAWIGAGETSDVYGCMDVFGLNYNADATADDGGCEYADHQVEAGMFYYAPTDLTINIGESVQWNNVDGMHDVVGNGDSFSFDACTGPCLIGSHTFTEEGTYDYICSVGNHAEQGMVGTLTVVDPNVDVTFSVYMSLETVSDDGVAVYGLNGNWSDGVAMTDDDGDGTFSATVSLESGSFQLYKFKNGGSWESVDELDCAWLDDPDGDGWGYWDRYLNLDGATEDVAVAAVCFGECDDCAVEVLGCTDPTANNYNPDANVDDDSCEYDTFEAANLFISEAAEGSSNNKYLEIFNASDATVDLSQYAFPNVSNAPSTPGVYEYWNTFAEGAAVDAGDVYVICHGSADEAILAECDQTWNYMSNGDDGTCLVAGSEAYYEILDCVGDFEADPGSGWAVAGVSNATKDHTIVRKSSVTEGAGYDWATSAGTDADDSQWVVLDQNTWAFLGTHPHDFASTCDDEAACNYGEEGDCTYADEGYDCDGNAFISVTFNVNMADQTVDTEGYGLDLYVDDPYGYHDMTDDDGDGVWSVTLTLLANTTYDYKFKNGEEWEVNFNDLGCGAGEDSTYGNRTMTTGDADMSLDAVCFNSCSDCETQCAPGDVNGDSTLDVLDVVSIVGTILDNLEPNMCADMNGDGGVDVLDVVAIVSIILDSRTTSSATEATLDINNGIASLDANGFVGAVQMTLSHGAGFSIELTNKAMVADYRTNGNSTTLIIVAPESDELFTASGDFNVETIIVANEDSQVTVGMPTELTLSKAYPNPFNPSTSMSVYVPADGVVNLSVFNIMGQEVATLHSGNMSAGNHTVTWNASNMTTGMYFVRAESSNGVAVQKVMLMK